MSKARVLLADDHRIVRSGLRGLMENEPAIMVVAEAEDVLHGRIEPQHGQRARIPKLSQRPDRTIALVQRARR